MQKIRSPCCYANFESHVYSALFSTLSAARETAINTFPSTPNSPQLWKNGLLRLVFVYGDGTTSQSGCLVCVFALTVLPSFSLSAAMSHDSTEFIDRILPE